MITFMDSVASEISIIYQHKPQTFERNRRYDMRKRFGKICIGQLYLAVILGISVVFLVPAASVAEYAFTTSINFPGAQETYLEGINDSGNIVGQYLNPSSPGTLPIYGSFLHKGGSFTPIVPGPFSIFAFGINNSDKIVGGYEDGVVGQAHGFFYEGEIFTSINAPGEAYTHLTGINNSGGIVGVAKLGNSGFLYKGGNFTPINIPHADWVNPHGINDSGHIVGSYQDTHGFHGFLYIGGTFTPIDVPGSPPPDYDNHTEALAINNSGHIVGSYWDAHGIHGFLYAGANLTRINVPGAFSTVASGINNFGSIVGYYLDFDSHAHGFMATPVPTIPVTIDIKPGSKSNPINLKNGPKIPVAILSTNDFNAPKKIDQNTLTFGYTGYELSLAFCNPNGEDINGDGLKDLVCHFYAKDVGFLCGDIEGILKGKTQDDTAIEGSDSVKISPCN
jgi:uncharacterized membrane protein